METSGIDPAIMSAPPRAVHTVFPVELDHIREVASRFNARLSESDVLHNVAAILAEEFSASRAAIVIAEADQHSRPIAAGFQLDEEFRVGWTDLAVGFPLAGMSILRNRVCVTGDVDSDPLLSLEQRAWLRENGVRAVWSVPLPAKSGEPAGAAVLMYDAPHRPDTSAVLMCQVYCQHAAMALDNARLYDALRTQAIHDSKTALFTHDYLLEAIRAELSRAARSGQPTALLMLDIDDYKSFNDTYGHVAGDQVLAELASIIRDQVRDSDTPARFGGEEFSVLLPGTPAVEAAEIAERIRAAIEAYPIRVKAGETAQVTISIGVAVHQGPSTNPDRVIEAADAALYDTVRQEHGPNRSLRTGGSSAARWSGVLGIQKRATRVARARLADRVEAATSRICTAIRPADRNAGRVADACTRFLEMLAHALRAESDGVPQSELEQAASTLSHALLIDRAESVAAAQALAAVLRRELTAELNAVFDRGIRFAGSQAYRQVSDVVRGAVDTYVAIVLADVTAATDEQHRKRLADLEGDHERLKQVAIRDGKTGLLNYDFFRERLQQELDRALRYEAPLSLIIGDLDDFKAYNDGQGHLFGDRVLALIAALITQSARSSDLVGRFGGEEFSVLLPHTDVNAGLTAAERIRRAVERAEFPARDGESTKMTISLGVAACPAHGDTTDALVDAADSAMYVAKRAGKNGVAVAGETTVRDLSGSS